MLRKARRSRLPRARRNASGRARVRSHSPMLWASALACQYSQLPKKDCTGAWIMPKSFCNDRMVSSPDAAAQPVVSLHLGRADPSGVDVGDDRVQPPAVQVVEGQLVPAASGLAGHDQPHRGIEQGRGGLGDLTALAALVSQRRAPHGVRVDGQGVDRRCDGGVLLHGDGVVRVVALGRGDHLVLVAGRIDPDPQPVLLSGAGRDRGHALVDEAAHRPPVVG